MSKSTNKDGNVEKGFQSTPDVPAQAEQHKDENPKHETGNPDAHSLADSIHVGGDKPQTVVSPTENEPHVTAQEAKAERIAASEARPLEQEVYAANPGGETETQFLERIMLMMRQGGWGRHLDKPLMERIKLINGK